MVRIGKSAQERCISGCCIIVFVWSGLGFSIVVHLPSQMSYDRRAKWFPDASDDVSTLFCKAGPVLFTDVSHAFLA